MIRLEQWELLKAIQGSVDLVHECLSQKHAGEPGCWKSSTALKTITRVCQAFEATPLLKETIAHLQTWRAFTSTDHVHGILLEFSESWNCEWEVQKQQLVQMEQWQKLQKLFHTRLTLLATLSGDDKVSTADFNDTLNELKGLKAMGCFGSWDNLDRAIQMLDPLSTDDHPLSEVEVSAAGRRQQDVQYVMNPLAITNGIHDSSR